MSIIMAKTHYNQEQKDTKPTTSSGIARNKERRKQKQARKARLIVRNLSFKTTEENFRKHFETYGEVREVTILKRPTGELVGCGFVQYKTTAEAAQALLKTNANTFLGRPIHVDWAVAKDTYVRHINEQKNPENIEIKTEKEDVGDVTIKEEPESDDEKFKVEDENAAAIPGHDSIEKQSNDSENSDDADSDDADSDDESMNDSIEDVKPQENLRKSANDATDGKTVFIKNVPFDAKNDDLRRCMEQFGDVLYALVCIDKMTEHSKGTAFVRFKEVDSAQRCLSAGTELTLLGQVLDPHPALSRDQVHSNQSKAKEKPQKDSRNLYLIKEGVVLAGTNAAEGVSMADMEKRLQLEQSKTQMLRNLNRFISKYRLTIHNLPDNYDDDKLRALCSREGQTVREARVMREFRPSAQNLKGRSKGYGFVSFTTHEDALATLRKLNNNPTIFSKKKRPIVSFSIEDRTAMNTKLKRQQKSLVANPNSKFYKANKNDIKNKTEYAPKWSQKSENKKYSEIPVSNDYSGVAAKPGPQKMRTKYGLKTQARMHVENLKKTKKQMKNMKKSWAERKAEQIRQPRQKQNRDRQEKSKDEVHLSKLINDYKNKLTRGGVNKKSKWYE